MSDIVENITCKRGLKTSLVLLAGVLLLAGFCAIHEFWRYGELEMGASEGMVVAQALEMQGNPPVCVAHHAVIYDSYPLFPLMLSWLGKLGDFPMPLLARLLALAALLGSTVIVYFSSGGWKNPTGALVAAGLFVSTSLMVEKSAFGDGYTLFCFWILAAQVVFFQLGVHAGRWSPAWAASSVFVGLAFYTGGFAAFWYFFLPLCFMRRPMKIWPRLKTPGFVIAVGILLAGVLFWLLPLLHLGKTLPVQGRWLDFGTAEEHLRHILFFPFMACVRLLPLALLAWIPFCQALKNLDDTPLWSRYLRTLTVVTFLSIYLGFVSDARSMMLFIAPLSILVGMYYNRARRMYLIPFRKCTVLCAFFTLFIAGAFAVFCLTPEGVLHRFFDLPRSIRFRESGDYQMYAIAMALVLSAAGSWILLTARQARLFLAMYVGAVAMALFYWMVLFTYRAQESQCRDAGLAIREALLQGKAPEGVPIYKHAIFDLHSEGYYSQHPFIRINLLSDLPDDQEVVYLLGTEFPQYAKRRWE
ncbi:MAG: hypothetical protein PHS41_06215, partial [Victivallaceae bacterium]|nr:hypothetical protein [Victivallaceae bacterium]